MDMRREPLTNAGEPKIEEPKPTGKRCEQCERVIPRYENVPGGFDSPEIARVENASVSGIPGMRVVKKVLCRDCYADAYKRVYKKDIKKDLPKEI